MNQNQNQTPNHDDLSHQASASKLQTDHEEHNHNHNAPPSNSGGYLDSILHIYRPFVKNSIENLEAFASGPLLYVYQSIKQNEIALLGVFGLFTILIIKFLTDLLGSLFSKKVSEKENC